ncbi:MAG: hypothetical protein NTW28_19460 [Candidatus Solibacter sp.]|nr:hypothetical protein [Candidatus Solibacter sp.]
MSVWPKTPPVTPSLSTAEGALVSVSIHVEPHCLESLLESLALVSFPINPQIYHDAALVYCYPGGREETESVTLVEFPAYEGRLDEVRRAVQSYGFQPDCIHAIGMLDDIQSDLQPEPAPEGAAYVSRHRVKRRPAVV